MSLFDLFRPRHRVDATKFLKEMKMTVDELSAKLDAVLAAVNSSVSAKDARIAALTDELNAAKANAVDPAVLDALGAKADAIDAALTPTP